MVKHANESSKESIFEHLNRWVVGCSLDRCRVPILCQIVS